VLQILIVITQVILVMKLGVVIITSIFSDVAFANKIALMTR